MLRGRGRRAAGAADGAAHGRALVAAEDAAEHGPDRRAAADAGRPPSTAPIAAPPPMRVAFCLPWPGPVRVIARVASGISTPSVTSVWKRTEMLSEPRMRPLRSTAVTEPTIRLPAGRTTMPSTRTSPLVVAWTRSSTCAVALLVSASTVTAISVSRGIRSAGGAGSGAGPGASIASSAGCGAGARSGSRVRTGATLAAGCTLACLVAAAARVADSTTAWVACACRIRAICRSAARMVSAACSSALRSMSISACVSAASASAVAGCFAGACGEPPWACFKPSAPLSMLLRQPAIPAPAALATMLSTTARMANLIIFSSPCPVVPGIDADPSSSVRARARLTAPLRAPLSVVVRSSAAAAVQERAPAVAAPGWRCGRGCGP